MEDVYIHRRFFILGIICVGLTGLLCGLLAGYGLGYHKGRESIIGGSATYTDTVRDTIRVVVPRATDSMRTGTIRVPVVIPMTEPGEPMVPKATIKVFEPDSLFGEHAASAMQMPTQPSAKGGDGGDNGGDGRDNGGDGYEARERGKFGRNDTVWIDLPRTQKRYEDSTYTAWVSGYDARLDSIHVYRRTVTRTVVVKDAALKGAARNWLHEHLGAGIVGGAGYGLTTKKPDVFVGVGGWIRIF